MENNKTSQQKMRTVDSTFADPWKPEQEGEQLSGKYLGKQLVTEGKKGSFLAYHIRDKEGKLWSVTGAGIATQMKQIPLKTDPITFTFKGYRTMDRGEMRVYEIQIPANVELLDPYADDSASPFQD